MMKRSKRKSKVSDETKLKKAREIWPLKMILELAQKILNKGEIKGTGLVFSAEDRKKLLFYSSKIEPMFTRIKQTPRTDIEPLERVIDDLREKIYEFSKNTAQV